MPQSDHTIRSGPSSASAKNSSADRPSRIGSAAPSPGGNEDGHPWPARSDSLRIAYLVYRGNPHSGGQGVYTRYLTRELAALGHQVTVFSGQPYPHLDDGVTLVKVPSLDLYRQPDPFRVPHLREFRTAIDVAEFGLMCTAGFPE